MQETFTFTEEPRTDWRIDEHTRSIGRLGIAAARARLAAVTSPTEAHSQAA